MKQFTWKDILNYTETGNQNVYFSKGTGISVGSFDGLHQGHRAILKNLTAVCKKNGWISGIVSFKRPLPSIKHSDNYQGDITTLNQRIKLFEELGIQFVIIVDFNKEFASTSGTDFLSILEKSCNMKFICEGIDFRFGYKGECDSSVIQNFADSHKIKASFVNQIFYKTESMEEGRISSSFIRNIIYKKDFYDANQLLTRPYQLELPSDNILEFNREDILQVVPQNGVFYCKNEHNQTVKTEISETSIILDKKSGFLNFV